jgi:acyl-ACP thioesterase
MKVEWSCKVGYMDIDPQFQMRLGVLARRLQEAAVTHSEQVGIRSRDLVANGAAWVLNKMAFRFGRLPRFGEDIRVVTWHKGSRGFTASREFEVWAGSERLVSAATLWLFIDLVKKRPRRIPAEWSAAYTIESGEALAFDLEGWQPQTPGPETTAIAVTLRSSDFDPQGHVNNTAYFDFLETLLARAYGERPAIEGLRIQFRREIAPRVAAVTVSLAPSPTGGVFQIHDERQMFVCGEFDSLPPPVGGDHRPRRPN